jgi:putative membrane protein
MMYGNGTGMGAIWVLIIFVIVLPCLLLAAASVAGQFRRAPSEPDAAERLLAGRFARGEIDAEEYERRLAMVRATGR